MSKEIIEIKAIAEDLHGNLVRTWENPEQLLLHFKINYDQNNKRATR